METVNYRKPVEGPELELTTSILEWLYTEWSHESESWVGREYRLGAGYPDILFVRAAFHAYDELDCLTANHARVLSYLKTVRKAKAATIAKRLAETESKANSLAEDLLSANLLRKTGNAFQLEDDWRYQPISATSIEVKVSNWKKALEQANRNRIFSNRSYIALPEDVASRIVANKRLLRASGTGVLSVSHSGEVSVLVDAKRTHPEIWYYYYKLALEVARHQSLSPQENR